MKSTVNTVGLFICAVCILFISFYLFNNFIFWSKPYSWWWLTDAVLPVLILCSASCTFTNDKRS